MIETHTHTQSHSLFPLCPPAKSLTELPLIARWYSGCSLFQMGNGGSPGVLPFIYSQSSMWHHTGSSPLTLHVQQNPGLSTIPRASQTRIEGGKREITKKSKSDYHGTLSSCCCKTRLQRVTAQGTKKYQNS